MWMLAIFFPYIALIKLRRYTEATIIALIWLFGVMLCLLFFPFAFVIWPTVGALLSITSIIAGLYTSQYYSTQRNDKLIDAITSAALLVSGKDAVAQPTFTSPLQETEQRTPRKPSSESYAEFLQKQLDPQWTRIQKTVIIAITASALLAGTGAYAYNEAHNCVELSIGGIVAALQGHPIKGPTPRICSIIMPIIGFWDHTRG